MGSLQQRIATLYADSRSLWVPERIQEYRGGGELVPFLRDHVGQSVPCVWRGAAVGWSAVEKWPDDCFQYLREKVGNKLVEVAITPDGRADAILEVQDHASGIIEKVFAMPHRSIQPFAELLDNLRDEPATHDRPSCRQIADFQDKGKVDHVPYYSAQDSSLTREVPELLEDIDQSTIQFAEAAFNSKPSATNIWIGDGRSVTTTHADPFENMYAVVTGTKLFELRPPCDAAVLVKPSLRHVRWIPVDGNGHAQQENRDLDTASKKGSIHPRKRYAGWSVETEHGMSEWIDEDRINDDWNRSLHVELNPGDLLYLPALWCK